MSETDFHISWSRLWDSVTFSDIADKLSVDSPNWKGREIDWTALSSAVVSTVQSLMIPRVTIRMNDSSPSTTRCCVTLYGFSINRGHMTVVDLKSDPRRLAITHTCSVTRESVFFWLSPTCPMISPSWTILLSVRSISRSNQNFQFRDKYQMKYRDKYQTILNRILTFKKWCDWIQKRLIGGCLTRFCRLHLEYQGENSFKSDKLAETKSYEFKQPNLHDSSVSILEWDFVNKAVCWPVFYFSIFLGASSQSSELWPADFTIATAISFWGNLHSFRQR